jgi:hypothetical protein
MGETFRAQPVRTKSGISLDAHWKVGLNLLRIHGRPKNIQDSYARMDQIGQRAEDLAVRYIRRFSRRVDIIN